MQIVDQFPFGVRDIEHVTIPVRDGVRLAARLWLPEPSGPVPALLEYIPYRKRDGTRLRDEPMHRWFAGHGYAAVRVDLRGSGESEGVLRDEYTATEQDDAEDVLAWIAAQPWCDGRVAMMGKSWGGFGALQVAARRPPQLRAVIAVCASDDRYADDAHYMGGCLLNENLLWGSMLMTLCAQPPSAALAGPGWRELWQQRIAAVEPFPALWLRHPLRDAYWRHGSICEDFDAVQVPVLAVSGWADGYSNAVLRLLAGLSCERAGVIGPWGHVYPHQGVPGPAIGFLQETKAFCDAWLKGDAEAQIAWRERPMLRAFEMASSPPLDEETERQGRWIAERGWPSEAIELRAMAFGVGGVLRGGGGGEGAASGAGPGPGSGSASDDDPSHREVLDDGRDAESPSSATRMTLPPRLVGAAAGAWCAFGLEGEMPGDQREEDAASMCFDSAPLTESLVVLGTPRVRVRLAVDRPAAMLCVRLCEVLPDGTSTRISYALLDLTHRLGHATAVAMPIGASTTIELPLNDCCHRFAVGSRLRVALSTTYWPTAWPSPEPVTLDVEPARSQLLLPIRRGPAAVTDEIPPWPPAQAAPLPDHRDIHEGGVVRHTEWDEVTRELVHETRMDLEPDGSPSRTRFDDIRHETGHGIVERFVVREGDPLSARAEVLHRTVTRSAGVDAEVELKCRLSADREAFVFVAELVAMEGGEEVARREWRERVPRVVLGEG